MLKIAIDFDGVIVEQPNYPELNYKFVDGAKEAILELHDLGYEFILNTGRYGWYRLPALWFIYKNNLPIKTTLFNKKPQADIFIDDRNIFCEKIDWIEIKNYLKKKLEG